MQKLLIILATVGVAYAGVRSLTPSEERRVLQQFASLCLSGSVNEQGEEIDGVQVYCKTGRGIIRDTFTKTVDADLGGGSDQDVYVQSLPVDLTHRVVVNAQHAGGRTRVYVVPGEVSNQYNVAVSGKSKAAAKPTVYYLRNKVQTQRATATQDGAERVVEISSQQLGLDRDPKSEEVK